MIRQLPVIRQIKQVKPPGARRDELPRWRNKARPEDKDGRVRKNEFRPFHKVLLLFFLLAMLAPQPAFWRGSGSDVKKKKNTHKRGRAECDGCSIGTTYPRLSDSLPFFDASRHIFCTISPPSCSCSCSRSDTASFRCLRRHRRILYNGAQMSPSFGLLSPSRLIGAAKRLA